MEKYVNVGREIRALMLSLTPLVEPVSIDEAFLDLSGTERLHHDAPAMVLARLAKRIEAEIGVSCRWACPTASSSPKWPQTWKSRAAFR